MNEGMKLSRRKQCYRKCLYIMNGCILILLVFIFRMMIFQKV